jgi:hypothetical protein
MLYLVSEKDWKTVRRIVKKLDRARGDGVENTPDSLSINAVAKGGATGLPGKKSDFFLVKVTKTNGADGTDSTPPAYVYTVYATDGTTVLGTNIPVIGPRPWGATTAPAALSDAMAVYKAGVLKLWSTLEIPTDEVCA